MGQNVGQQVLKRLKSSIQTFGLGLLFAFIVLAVVCFPSLWLLLLLPGCCDCCHLVFFVFFFNLGLVYNSPAVLSDHQMLYAKVKCSIKSTRIASKDQSISLIWTNSGQRVGVVLQGKRRLLWFRGTHLLWLWWSVSGSVRKKGNQRKAPLSAEAKEVSDHIWALHRWTCVFVSPLLSGACWTGCCGFVLGSCAESSDPPRAPQSVHLSDQNSANCRTSESPPERKKWMF